MTDKYVSDMNPAELRAHMRRLKAMPGWHDPLSDSLYAEIQRMDANMGEDARDALMLELLESYEAIFRSAYCQLDADDDLIRRVRAAPSASAQQAEPVALKLPEGFVDAVWLSICELPGRTSPEDDPEACICDYDEFKGCFESAQESFAAPAPNASPAAEQRDECGMTESDWKRAEALADMLRLPDERTNALQSALQDSRYGDEPKQVESPHEQRERVQFEQAFPRLEKERDSRGHYDRHLTRLAWQGWLARAILAASPADQGEDARDTLMLELLESYEAIFRSAYCQLDADDDLIRRVRAAMSASKEPK